MRGVPVIPVVLAAGLAALATAHPAAGQDVRYTSVTRAEYGGSLGRIIRLAPGGPEDIVEVTSIKGDRLRTDEDRSSTIVDLEAGALTWLNHERRTYVTMEMAAMVERSRAMGEAMADSLEAVQQEPSQGPQDVRYEARVSADRTGKRAKFAGYEAEQVFITLEIEAIPIPQEGEDEEDLAERGGTLVILSEQWLSESFPGYVAMKAQQERWSKALGITDETSEDMKQAFAFDTRIQQGFEKLAEEMKGLEGMALKTVTHVISVPYRMTFDRKAALKDADKSLASDITDAAAEGAVESAKAKIGGLFGKKKEPEKPKPKQATIMRVKGEVTECDTSPLADDLFIPPSGYSRGEGF